MSHHQREINSLRTALDSLSVQIVDHKQNGHIRIKIQCTQTKQIGNITLSASPSDLNVQRQRERQIKKELQRIGVQNYDRFSWRKL